MLYLNLFRSGGALVETQPNGDESVELRLPGQAGKTLAGLVELESFRISEALAALFLAGATAGERAVSAGRRSGRGSAGAAATERA